MNYLSLALTWVKQLFSNVRRSTQWIDIDGENKMNKLDSKCGEVLFNKIAIFYDEWNNDYASAIKWLEDTNILPKSIGTIDVADLTTECNLENNVLIGCHEKAVKGLSIYGRTKYALNQYQNIIDNFGNEFTYVILVIGKGSFKIIKGPENLLNKILNTNKRPVSSRGIPLLCRSSVTSPTLTAEKYSKWYNLYIAFPDSSTMSLEDYRGCGIELIPRVTSGYHIDHCYHPNYLLEVGRVLDMEVDVIALEVAAGRWVLEEHSLGKDFGYFLN